MTHRKYSWNKSDDFPWGEARKAASHLQQAFGQALDDVVKELDSTFGSSEEKSTKARKDAFDPEVDILETSEAVIVCVDLPGLQRDEVELSFEEQRLEVSGERTRPEKQEGAKTRQAHRGFGEFNKSLKIPVKIDPEKIEASMRLGVLTVTLPKAVPDKPSSVKIEVKG